jgi:hypothetical protein
MMGRLKSDQGQLFYKFHLGDAVPEDPLVRKINAALDLSWLRSELALTKIDFCEISRLLRFSTFATKSANN